MFGDDSRMRRVSKRQPCAICGRPDWCGYSADGRFAVCMRMADGAVKVTRNGGYLHILREEPRDTVRRRARVVSLPMPEARADLGALAAEYAAAVDLAKLRSLAEELGLSVESLVRLRIGWAAPHRAWSFPMEGEDGRVQGIRLRTWSGRKFAVTGGREGLFVPVGLDLAGSLLVCEGPTDTASLLDLGFQAIGRPCAKGGTSLLVILVKRHEPQAVVIVADVDENEVGQQGARTLATMLLAYVPTVKIITPPAGAKDAREWKRAGATYEDVAAAIETTPRWKVRIARRRRT